MKILAIKLIAFATLLTTASFNTTIKKAATEDKGFAVIELFTSEGCSSCPPADALTAKIAKETSNRPVYILGYHVDYWNRLGWKDPFSDAEYSKRQSRYAQWLHLSGVYTPQIVVNGKTEFVGSNEKALRRSITAGLKNDISTPLTLKQIKTDGNKLQLQYSLSTVANNFVLMIALIQNNATTNVKSGENGGRSLQHINIVSRLQTIDISGRNQGTAIIPLPPNYTAHTWKVIGFVQNTSTGEITGAKQL